METPEIEIDGEQIIFDYYIIPDEPATGFYGSIEINAIYENAIELNAEEEAEFFQRYGEEKIKEMILSGSIHYK